MVWAQIVYKERKKQRSQAEAQKGSYMRGGRDQCELQLKFIFRFCNPCRCGGLRGVAVGLPLSVLWLLGR